MGGPKPPIAIKKQTGGGPILVLVTLFISSLVGACTGRLLNIILTRGKNGGFLAVPFCPHCNKSFSGLDHVPVLGFILAKGKCRYCDRSLSMQYPLLESLTALLFMLSALIYSNQWLTLLGSFVFVGFLILLGTSDARWRLMPHSFNNLFILCGFLFATLRFYPVLNSLFITASGFFIVGAFLFLLTQYFPLWLGGGDVKMLAGLAVWLGVFNAFYVLLIASGIAVLLFLMFFLMGTHKITLKTAVPFGPYLSMGALAVWFWPEFVVLKGIMP
jgi:prepilin signal peptidase PulO-like enzyme (type II secretory pathway)